jgi:hypothetical protein
MAYMDGFKVAFAIAVALLGMGFLLALAPKWNAFRPGQEEASKAGSKSEESSDQA